MKKVMIFGIFDGAHENHKAVLEEAAACGDELIAVVAQDHIVRHLKGKEPTVNFIERFEELQKQDNVSKVVIGDAELSVWRIVDRYKPDVVAFASDQDVMRDDLENNKGQLQYQPVIQRLTAAEINPRHD